MQILLNYLKKLYNIQWRIQRPGQGGCTTGNFLKYQSQNRHFWSFLSAKLSKPVTFEPLDRFWQARACFKALEKPYNMSIWLGRGGARAADAPPPPKSATDIHAYKERYWICPAAQPLSLNTGPPGHLADHIIFGCQWFGISTIRERNFDSWE